MSRGLSASVSPASVKPTRVARAARATRVLSDGGSNKKKKPYDMGLRYDFNVQIRRECLRYINLPSAGNVKEGQNIG